MDCYLRFPHFKSRAVTLSYDDGRIEDLRLVDVMRRYGLKGTLNLNSERLSEAGDEFHPTLNDFRALRESGDIEIAVHGAKHLRPTKFPTPLVLREIMADREALEKMFGTVVRGMAYAYGAYNDEVISALSLSGVAYARLATSNSSFDIPTDWLTLSPTAKHMNQNLFELTRAVRGAKPQGSFICGDTV